MKCYSQSGKSKVQWPPKHTQNVRARVCRKKITKWLYSEVSYTKWAEKAAIEWRRKDAQNRIDDNEEFLRLAFLVFRLDKATAGIALEVDAGCRIILGCRLFWSYFRTWFWGCLKLFRFLFRVKLSFYFYSFLNAWTFEAKKITGFQKFKSLTLKNASFFKSPFHNFFCQFWWIRNIMANRNVSYNSTNLSLS